MNKDLLLVFVIGPLVVEVGKAIIKEYQDRKAIDRQKNLQTSKPATSLVIDLERTCSEYFDDNVKINEKDFKRTQLLKVLADVSDVFAGLPGSEGFRVSFNDFAHKIGRDLFRAEYLSSSDLTEVRSTIKHDADKLIELLRTKL